MTLPLYPPDYCDRATLAYRLGVEHGCIDQMVRRGEIPPPVAYSGAERWRWIDVDEWLRRLQTIPGLGIVGGADDPAIRGLANAPPARQRPPRQIART